ncbi:putative regulatory protein [Escherichia coli]|nr:putative regulatory protein [Escherichia coli]
MLTSITGHDSVLLRADDPLIDMNYITSFTGMTDKWFYKLISEGHFPKPIKLGRSSRWYKSEVEQWMQQRIEESRGQQHETCCNASTLAMCKMPALVLWNPALPLVLATFTFIFLQTFSSQPAGYIYS